MTAKKKATVKTREIGKQDVTFDKENANRHTAKGRELVDKSIGELGAGRSVLVDKNGVLIAGNLTTETAIGKGLKMIEVETDGDTLIVVKRTDLDMEDETDNRARKMAIVDNSSALFGIDFDKKTLEELSKNFDFGLGEWGVDVSKLGVGVETVNGSSDEWVGMPEFEPADLPFKIVISFENEDDVKDFEAKFPEIKYLVKRKTAWSTWWPYKESDDLKNVKYEQT